jgi:Tfp pilus assembly protein PilF
MVDWRRWFDRGHPDPEALLRKGERLERRGRIADAERVYRRADDAGSADAAACLGILLIDRHEFDAAHAALCRAEAGSSDLGAFWLGILAEEEGRPAEAEAAYRRAIKLGSTDAERYLIAMLSRRGDTAGIDTVRSLVAGFSALPADRLEFAVAVLARRAKKDDIVLAENLTHIARQTGQPADKTESAYRRALAHAKAENAANLIAMLHERGDVASTEAARTLLNEITGTSTADSVDSTLELATDLAIQETDKGNEALAERIVEEVVATDQPARYRAAVVLGLLRKRRADTTGARRAYQVALPYHHTVISGVAALELGIIDLNNGNPLAAEPLFRTAAESAHTEARAQGTFNLALVLAHRGATDQARVYYSRVADSGHPELAPKAAARLRAMGEP